VEVGDTVGRMAVLLDPDGNHVGLMQLAEHAHRHFRWGRFQRPLEPDQLEEFGEAKEAGGIVVTTERVRKLEARISDLEFRVRRTLR
jgi:hypothetical protein